MGEQEALGGCGEKGRPPPGIRGLPRRPACRRAQPRSREGPERNASRRRAQDGAAVALLLRRGDRYRDRGVRIGAERRAHPRRGCDRRKRIHLIDGARVHREAAACSGSRARGRMGLQTRARASPHAVLDARHRARRRRIGGARARGPAHRRRGVSLASEAESGTDARLRRVHRGRRRAQRPRRGPRSARSPVASPSRGHRARVREGQAPQAGESPQRVRGRRGVGRSEPPGAAGVLGRWHRRARARPRLPGTRLAAVRGKRAAGESARMARFRLGVFERHAHRALER